MNSSIAMGVGDFGSVTGIYVAQVILGIIKGFIVFIVH
mgnify:CR=1 FL=1